MSKTLSIAIRDQARLYECYMPFVKNGGLFVPADPDCTLGEEVCVILDLMHEPEPIHLTATVVWITPKGAQGNRPAGVGVGLDGRHHDVRSKIETRLAGAVNSERSTHTL